MHRTVVLLVVGLTPKQVGAPADKKAAKEEKSEAAPATAKASAKEKSGDDAKKPVKVPSGGKTGRMMFGNLMLGQHNLLLMDEPTNHMDMESIESLNLALDKYNGTLVFVSHDREFVNSLATRILEVQPDRVEDFRGTYDEYLASQGVQ